MAKQYDATLKQLVESRPRDWLQLLGIPATTGVQVLDADVSSITAAADKVIRVEDVQPFLVHLEFQLRFDSWLDLRVLFYNVVLRWRHRLPVRSVVILLNPGADQSRVVGRFAESSGSPAHAIDFRYEVVRVWELDPEKLLAGDAGIVPLAPLASSPDQLTDVFARVDHRLRDTLPAAEADNLLTAAFILGGIRHDKAVMKRLLQGVRSMRESTSYQLIVEEGELKGERRALLLLGSQQFGEPPPNVLAVLNSIENVRTLEALLAKVLDVSTWSELLASIGNTHTP